MIGATLFIMLVTPVIAILSYIVIHWFMLWYNGFDLLIEFCKTFL